MWRLASMAAAPLRTGIPASSSCFTTESPYWWMETPMRGITTSARGKRPPLQRSDGPGAASPSSTSSGSTTRTEWPAARAAATSRAVLWIRAERERTTRRTSPEWYGPRPPKASAGRGTRIEAVRPA